MTLLPTKFLTNRATIETYLGAGATGPKWLAPKENVRCRLDGNERVTVQTARGITTVARATMYVRPDDKPTLQSRVVIDGIRYEVLDVTPINGPTSIEGYKAAVG